MNKKEYTEKINALEIKGLNFPEDTEINNDVLDAILKVGNAEKAAKEKVSSLETELKTTKEALVAAEDVLEELTQSNSDLTEEVALLKKSGGKFISPVVEVAGKKYTFQDPKFRLPKAEATSAEEVAARMDKVELAECIKRGVLVLVKKEVKNV
jgi:malonyl CoA-acyl carrier protein transacylase